MFSVLLVDDNKDWLDILEVGISRVPNLYLVGKADTGLKAINSIEELRPNIIVLDIIMPEYDGIYILNHIRQMVPAYKPKIYILSGIGTQTIVKILNDLDVDYYSLKPVSIDLVIDVLTKITAHPPQEPHDRETEAGRSPQIAAADPVSVEMIKRVLNCLGIPSHLFSTKCMITALVLYHSDSNSHIMLTKDLYPKVAKSLGLSSSSVERNLRNAVAKVMGTRTTLFRELFPNGDRKISNGEFLATIDDYMRNNYSNS